MDRVVSIRTRRNLQTRAKPNTASAGRCDYKAPTVWLFPRPDQTSVTPSSILNRTSNIGTFSALLRWTFNATVDGLALYAASHRASTTPPMLLIARHEPVRKRTF